MLSTTKSFSHRHCIFLDLNLHLLPTNIRTYIDIFVIYEKEAIITLHICPLIALYVSLCILI